MRGVDAEVARTFQSAGRRIPLSFKIKDFSFMIVRDNETPLTLSTFSIVDNAL